MGRSFKYAVADFNRTIVGLRPLETVITYHVQYNFNRTIVGLRIFSKIKRILNHEKQNRKQAGKIVISPEEKY